MAMNKTGDVDHQICLMTLLGLAMRYVGLLKVLETIRSDLPCFQGGRMGEIER